MWSCISNTKTRRRTEDNVAVRQISSGSLASHPSAAYIIRLPESGAVEKKGEGEENVGVKRRAENTVER